MARIYRVRSFLRKKQKGLLSPDVSNVNVTINGVQATISLGSLTPGVNRTLTGVAATAQAGAITPNPSGQAVGVVATAQAGTFTPEGDKTLSGAQATATASSIPPTVAPTVTGVSAIASAGTATALLNIPLFGTSVTASAGAITPSVLTGALTGVSATATTGSLVSRTVLTSVLFTEQNRFFTSTLVLPGAGKRADFPSYVAQPPRNAKPAKPFRPVWDRPKPGEIGIPAAQPPRPVPLPPPQIFASAPPVPLSRVGLPTFDHLAPADPEELQRRMQEAQDMSDAMAVLQHLGLLPQAA